MAIYVSKAPKEDGTVKFYCPLKSEKFLMILKFKMKIGETRIIEPPTMSYTGQQRITESVHSLTATSYEPVTAPYNNNASTSVIRPSPDLSHDISLPVNPRAQISITTHSTPNIVSDPLPNQSKKKKRDEFQFSQESVHPDQKKTRKTTTESVPKLSHLLASIDKTPTTDSNSNSNSLNFTTLQPRNFTPLQKTPPVERTLIPLMERMDQRSDKKSDPPSDSKTNRTEYRSEKIEVKSEFTDKTDRTIKSDRIEYKTPADHRLVQRQIPPSKPTSIVSSAIKSDSGVSSVYKSDGKPPVFGGKTKTTSFVGNDGKFKRIPINFLARQEVTTTTSLNQATKINEEFSNKLKNAMREMKL